MREELKNRDGKRGEFSATFERYGRAKVTIPGYGKFKKRPPQIEVVTLLFRDVKDSTGQTVTDHIWFKTCKAWAALGLRPGERVKFEARIMPYEKGYAGDDGGRVTDYKLGFPTKVRLVTTEPLGDLPLFRNL